MTAVLLGLAMVAALALSGLFSGTETGLVNTNRGRITHMARSGSKAAATVARAMGDLPRTLTCLLVGNNIANVAFSSASAALCARACGGSAGLEAAWNAAAALAMLAFGEYLPKLLCMQRPLRRTLNLAPFYRAAEKALRPLTAVAAAATGAFAPPPAREKVTPDDLLRILRDRKNGVRLTNFESALIAKILVLRKKGLPVTADALLSALEE